MVEWIMTSSVLILSIIAIRYMFRNRLALWARYALWSLVALRLLVPFSFSESSFSVLNLLRVEESAVRRAVWPYSETEEGQEKQGGYSMFGSAQAGTQEISQAGTQSTSQSKMQGMFQPEMQGISQLGAQNISQAKLQDKSAEAEISDNLRKENQIDENEASRIFSALREKSRFLLWIWLLGTVQCAGIVIVVNWRYAAKVHRSRRRYTGNESSAIPVYVSRVVRTPCMLGLVHPAVYLTPKAVENPHVLRHVLCHENTHYRHRDNWWAVVRTACLCIHWYNPLVWTATYLSRQDCELACDEETLKRLGEDNRIAYGRSLLECSVQESVSYGCLQLSTTMAGGKKQLKERLMKIVNETKNCKSALVSVLVLSMMALLATFTGGKDGQDRVFAEGDNPSVAGSEAGVALGSGNLSQGEADDMDGFDGIASGSVTTDRTASESVTSGSMAPDSVTSGNVTDIADASGEGQEPQRCVEDVALDLNDAGSYVLRVESDTVPGSGVYQIEEISVIRQQGGTEDVIQSIRAGDVKALYTKCWGEVGDDELTAWNFASQEEVLFAKSLYSAEEVPVAVVGRFESDGGGQMCSYASNGGILVADLNFDGYNDFCVQTGVGSANTPYYCFLWKPEEGKFEHGSMIPNVQTDEESKCVKSVTRDGESVYSIKYYRFDENNTAHLVRYVEENQSSDAVFPLLDLTCCEGGYYDLPAVDDWDYFTEYGGRMTERFVYWAKQALTELYEWSGTRVDTACFSVTDFGMFTFANSLEDMQAGRTFYDRVYGLKAGFRSCIESMDLSTERDVWFSDVTQWNVPENLDSMTDAQVVQWYVERSALAEGEKVKEVSQEYEDSYLIRMESGNYYQVFLNLTVREVDAVYGPYDGPPVH